jgi:hypothetical protein
MTAMPGPADHAAHDPVLVAAYAAGDAEAEDLARASALVASCPECAALHRDLRALAASLASTPAPARPRDFRLSAEQADQLRRPTGWRRLLAPLGGARSAAGPLAASLAALGVAGLLLSGSLGALPLGGTATSMRAPAADQAAPGAGGAGYGTSSGPGTENLAPVQPAASAQAAASAAPSQPATEGPVAAAASAAPSTAPIPMASAGSASGPGSASAAPSAAASSVPGTQSIPAPSAAPSSVASDGSKAASAAPSATAEAAVAPSPGTTGAPAVSGSAVETGGGPSPLAVGSALLLVAGVVLGVLRLVARRVAQPR